jgi:isopentenyl diphosphate isomerase/L-lactate dehydrogenase-like FMN-dependent dehydrogenase
MLGVIKSDLDVALALTGHTSFEQLDRSALYPAERGPEAGRGLRPTLFE